MTQEELFDLANKCGVEIVEETDKKFIPINIDFDSTLVLYRYPNVGKDIPFAVKTLKRWIKDYNVGLILHTSRGDESDLIPCLKWFAEHDIPLWGIGKNPTQDKWCKSSKSFGYYIDDMCAGIPLIFAKGERPYIDWLKLNEYFEPMLKLLKD